MLIKLEKLIARYNMNISGVVHAGAHEGQEIGDYLSVGINNGTLFEPCNDAFDKLKENIVFTGFRIVRVALGNKTGMVYINKEHTSGQSNSILEPKLHKDYYPDIKFNGGELVYIEKLDNYFIIDCNLLVLDVQGYELEVLKGATLTLKHIDYIITEVNREELYEGCAMVGELDNYLKDFKRVETKWLRKGWGDACYIRKTLL